MTGRPPDLPGYEYVDDLGSGGFADVYRYRHHLGREVAVKVVRDPSVGARFQEEARRMAALSTHPAIVTIYEVGVAGDGRPYLTMEHCPGGHLGSVVLARPPGVPRALTIGVRIAAAVETAHRNGILHRDIKPANVLLTEFGEPVLIDFGIAGGVDELADSQGFSVPFAAPEVLTRASDGDVSSDVYSLGATVYATLAGRSPFHTGTPIADAALIERILHVALPPTGRTDVPPSLERVLARALARRPGDRFESAAAFGRALQSVELELGLAQTPLTIPDDAGRRPDVAPPTAGATDDPGATRVKPYARVDPDGPAPVTPVTPATPAIAGPRNDPAPWAEAAPVAVLPPTGLGDRTVARGGAPAPAATPDDANGDGRVDGRTRRLVIAGASALVLVVAVAFLFTRVGGSAEDDAGPATTVPDTRPIVVGQALARPERVQVNDDGDDAQLVTWSAPSAAEGDQYRVTFTDGPAALRGEQQVVSERELRLDTARRVCVSVETLRSGRLSDASQEVCSR